MRNPDWPERLAEIIEAYRFTPFEWGIHDCMQFASRCVWAQTGIDPASEYRGEYNTAAGAYRVLSKIGGIDAVMEKQGFHPVPKFYAQRGDIISYMMDGQEALGVCIGATSAFISPEGMIFIPLDKCERAWRV